MNEKNLEKHSKIENKEIRKIYQAINSYSCKSSNPQKRLESILEVIGLLGKALNLPKELIDYSTEICLTHQTELIFEDIKVASLSAIALTFLQFGLIENYPLVKISERLKVDLWSVVYALKKIFVKLDIWDHEIIEKLPQFLDTNPGLFE
ncbi:MAG: hypothetical protein ACTSU2_00500 [Promethearchaeota archaeon]